MDPLAAPALEAAMQKMWTKFLPLMEERLAILEEAAAALSAASLTREQRLAASSAAHKLAGVLGSFGLAQGTELAREAEIFYSREEALAPAAAQIAAMTAELRAMIEKKKQLA
jgi:HPt (histidine-containing phosphotransfer) domain-containing protein